MLVGEACLVADLQRDLLCRCRLWRWRCACRGIRHHCGIRQPPLLVRRIFTHRHLGLPQFDDDPGDQLVTLVMVVLHPCAQVQAGTNGKNALGVAQQLLHRQAKPVQLQAGRIAQEVECFRVIGGVYRYMRGVNHVACIFGRAWRFDRPR